MFSSGTPRLRRVAAADLAEIDAKYFRRSRLIPQIFKARECRVEEAAAAKAGVEDAITGPDGPVDERPGNCIGRVVDAEAAAFIQGKTVIRKYALLSPFCRG